MRNWLDRGRELFRGAGGCVQCHGDTGLGDGEIKSYDDWTKWAKDAKVDPDDPATYAPFVAEGAFASALHSPAKFEHESLPRRKPPRRFVSPNC